MKKVFFLALFLFLTACSSTNDSTNEIIEIDISENPEETDFSLEDASVSVNGIIPPLPEGIFLSNELDQALGTVLPEIIFEHEIYGESTIDPNTGKPKMIFFLGHWCEHCEDEIVNLQVTLGSLEGIENIETHLVLTENVPGSPNFPPDEWINSRLWPESVQIHYDDEDSTAGRTYGSEGVVPYTVIADPTGRVLFRAKGGSTLEGLRDNYSFLINGVQASLDAQSAANQIENESQ